MGQLIAEKEDLVAELLAYSASSATSYCHLKATQSHQFLVELYAYIQEKQLFFILQILVSFFLPGKRH